MTETKVPLTVRRTIAFSRAVYEGNAEVEMCIRDRFDTGTKVSTCIGVAFEVGKNDTDIRKYTFFSHSGKIPEDEYLTEKGVPYTIAGLRKLVEKRVDSSDNRGRGDVNRLYPSKEAYLKTVYDVIFGYVEPGRMMTCLLYTSRCV